LRKGGITSGCAVKKDFSSEQRIVQIMESHRAVLDAG
jgi:hypothetical protein